MMNLWADINNIKVTQPWRHILYTSLLLEQVQTTMYALHEYEVYSEALNPLGNDRNLESASGAEC